MRSSSRAPASGGTPPKVAGRVDRGLIALERTSLDPDGLPGRPWVEHTVYDLVAALAAAPGGTRP